jgi:hypothetical protein
MQSSEFCKSVAAVGSPRKGGDEVGKWRLKRRVQKSYYCSADIFAIFLSISTTPRCVQSEISRV